MYGEQVQWNYGNYTVQSIYGQWAGSLNTCCLWGFHGNTSLSHTPAGSANFQAFAQGTFPDLLSVTFVVVPVLWYVNFGIGHGSGHVQTTLISHP